SGRALGLGHVHLGLPIPALVGRDGVGGRTGDPTVRARDGRGVRRGPAHRVRPAGRGRGLVVGRRRVDGDGPGRTVGRGGEAHVPLSVPVHRLLPVRRGLHARVRRPG